MELIESKSILAKLMATENLIVEQRKVQTASFDVKNRVLTIPILDKNISSELYDLFTGHEVGHALYTPLEGMKKAKDMDVNMNVANVVEDSRIERLIKDKYPGLRNSFYTAYKELLAKDFFGTHGRDINRMNFLDRLNLHCKGGSIGNIRFTEEEKNLVNLVENTKTYDDVIDVSDLITDYMRKKLKEDDGRESYPFDDSYDDETDDYYDFEDDDYEDAGDDYDRTTFGRPSKKDIDSEGDDGSESENFTDEFEDDEKSMDHKIVCETQKEYEKNEYKLFSEENTEYVYMNVSEVNYKKCIVDHKTLYSAFQHYYKNSYYVNDLKYLDIGRENYLTIRAELSKVVSYLVKEFEMRKNASQLKRASIAKTGELNMKKIFSYNFSEDIFKKITVVPGGKSHGLVLFLDWSGSMSNYISSTMKQLISLVLFCKKVNIPYEVYAFCDDDIWCRSSSYRGLNHKDGDFHLSPFSLANILSSKMSAREFTDAISTLVYVTNQNHRNNFFKMSGTPLNETICAAMELVPEFQKQNKLQVVNTVFLTDGDSNCNLLKFVKNEDRDSVIDYSYRRCNFVLRDPKTKNEVIVESAMGNYGGAAMTSMRITSALFQLYKMRTQHNTLGFYILRNNKEMVQKLNRYEKMDFYTQEKMKAEFNKNKALVVKAAGFDEYYLIKLDGNDIEDEFVVNQNATTRGLVSAFSKYTKNRLANRLVLNRFIGLIS